MSVFNSKNLVLFRILLSVSLSQVFALDECTVTEYNQVTTVLKSCKNIVIDNLKVPGGKPLNLNLNPNTTLTFKGNTTFEYHEWHGPLIRISGSDILIRGEVDSVLDGQGPLWWDGQGIWGGVAKPRFASVVVNNTILENINILNCPVGCIIIHGSNNVTLRNWKIDNLAGDEGVAPPHKFAHNTDGFGIGASSNNILIEDSIVYNQDDCVVVKSGRNITIRRLFCHGSHGLSISGNAEILNDVLIEDSIVSMAENGIHIKTHVNASEGLINNVTYRNIQLLDSKSYGINIQQNYQNLPAGQPQDGPTQNNTPIRNLSMINIFGNVLAGAVPVYVLCAEEGCFDWKWDSVEIYGARADNCTNYVPDGYNC